MTTSAAPNPTRAVTVTLHNVSRFFGRFPALLGINAEFSPGDVCALLGGNGSGKSTLLRIITGLASPSEGTVERNARIGYMAHASMLYDELSGAENLAYFAALHGVSADSLCSEAMKSVGLDPSLKRPVRDYSQGMRQRLSLVRAIIHDPDLILLDEPFSNVDAPSATLMLDLLGRLKARHKTMIIVTHQPELLSTLASRTLVLADGRMVENTRANA